MSQIEHQHGVKGVYYGGKWLDIEDCAGKFTELKDCSGCEFDHACPRSTSRNYSPKIYDICIIGAGCIGAAIARELSKYEINIIWVEAADDVSQGATKGNSGIVHAGYDDEPGSVRAKHCWPGNQMFAELDRQLRFGYQKNGSLVLANNDMEKGVLKELLERGKKNGVRGLCIIDQKELNEMEPHAKGVAALYAPEAGQVIPYEFTIALAENAVDNGVELLIRSPVTAIKYESNGLFQITVSHWEPQEFVDSVRSHFKVRFLILGLGVIVFIQFFMAKLKIIKSPTNFQGFLIIALYIASKFLKPKPPPTKDTPLTDLVKEAGKPHGTRKLHAVSVSQMLVGGSGSETVQHGTVIGRTVLSARYVINCAGGNADQVAKLIGDESFHIKPRLGDYLLLNRNQGHLTKHTLFPCPDPVLGKGVLVQTTLWGNLILGPTARDTYKPEARDMSPMEVQEYILTKCRKLCGDFDPKETFHAFCGARAKSDRGDWIIEFSKQNDKFLHVAGIDSPGLAGAPSIATTVCKMLQAAGLKMPKNPKFNPSRAPIIIPKNGMKGLKMGAVGKYDSDGSNTAEMAANVICKCEKVTELEVVTAVRRSLPIDSSQAIRKRTRAGMGHCQGDCDNYNCEARVRAIVARETGVPVAQVGARPWPATSTLSKRWIDDNEKQQLEERMMKQ